MIKHVAAVILTAGCGSAGAATIEIGPAADFRTAMQTLQAGDTLILDAGTYTLTRYFALSLTGTSASPITIVAKAGTRPLIHFSGTSQNIVNFSDTTFLIVDGIEFSGGSRGLRFIGGSDDIVRNCIIHDTAANAISANDDGEDYARFQFLHNEIYNTGDTGEGFYLGCNGDACRIHDSIVANNYIHDLDNSNISQGDGIEIKKGSYANIVRDNVIRDVNYPGITMYDVNGHGAPNLIERNIVWNSHDSGIQITADAIVRNNIVLGAANNAFFSNNIDSGSANNLTIVNNTFVMPQGDGIRLNGVTGSVLIANNAIYAPNGDAVHASGTTTGVTFVANAGQGTLNGVGGTFADSGNVANDFVLATLSGVPPQNLIPKGALLVGTGEATDEPADDFDGHPRSGHVDIGAYRAGGNPGWTIQSAFKTPDEIYFGTFDPDLF